MLKHIEQVLYIIKNTPHSICPAEISYTYGIDIDDINEAITNLITNDLLSSDTNTRMMEKSFVRYYTRQAEVYQDRVTEIVKSINNKSIPKKVKQEWC